MKILLTGADGQVGFELQRSLACLGEVHATTRAVLDLEKPGSIRSLMRELRPDIVVNAAAYTAVDKAESEEALAFAINAEAPRVLAEEAARLGAGMVHYSTDYVFDGRKAGPYVEEDPTNPLGIYGRSKLAGEAAVGASTTNVLIFRSSWVYARRGRNFALTMLKLGEERERLRVVADQFGAPTPARLIADATALVLKQVGAPKDISERCWPAAGLYHMSCSGRTSWHEFACFLLASASRKTGRPMPQLDAITAAEYPSAATRPANSVLDNRKLETGFGIKLPPWQRSYELFF